MQFSQGKGASNLVKTMQLTYKKTEGGKRKENKYKPVSLLRDINMSQHEAVKGGRVQRLIVACATIFPNFFDVTDHFPEDKICRSAVGAVQ